MLDVIVLNAHRRGDWFLGQLEKSKRKFEVFDLSKALGERSDEDIFGPFGWMKSPERVLEDESAGLGFWLQSRAETQVQTQGWAVWSDKGNFEAHGLLREHQKKNFAGLEQSLFKNFFSSIDAPIQTQNSWPMPATMDGEYLIPRKFRSSPSWPVTEVTSEKMLSLETQPGRRLFRYEGRDLTASFVVSFLNGYEMMSLPQSGLARLLSGEALQPRLVWQKCRIRLLSEPALEPLPVQLCLVPRISEPWVEDNALVLQKTSEAGVWNLWYRTWYKVHRDEKYFNELFPRLQETLAAQIPFSASRLLEKPAEVEGQGTALHAIYDHTEWDAQQKWFTQGVFWGGGEKNPNFAWTWSIALQSRIFKSLQEELTRG